MSRVVSDCVDVLTGDGPRYSGDSGSKRIWREWTDFQTPRGRGNLLLRHRLLCSRIYGIPGRSVPVEKPLWWYGPSVVARPR